MGYKMKQDESPVTYTLPSGTLGYQPGTFTSGATGATGAGSAAGAAGGGMPGLGMAAGALGSVIDEFKPEDPTEKGYMGASIGSKALELGAMGAKVGGPIGAGVGVVVGATIGGLTARKEAREARKQKRIQRRAERKGDAISTLAENQAAMGGVSGVFNPQDPYNFSNVAMKKGEIKMKPIKKLGAITGTISPNMSMAQYKDEMKFSAIARNIDEPIMNLGFIKAKTLEKDPNATTMVVDGETMPIKN
jgi:gas vesicle protein